jgi:hypothetical protein
MACPAVPSSTRITPTTTRMIPRVHRIGIPSKYPTTSRIIPRMITLASREPRLGASRSAYGRPARFAPAHVDCPEIPQDWCVPHGVAPDVCRYTAASSLCGRPPTGPAGRYPACWAWTGGTPTERHRLGRVPAVRRQVAPATKQDTARTNQQAKAGQSPNRRRPACQVRRKSGFSPFAIFPRNSATSSHSIDPTSITTASNHGVCRQADKPARKLTFSVLIEPPLPTT